MNDEEVLINVDEIQTNALQIFFIGLSAICFGMVFEKVFSDFYSMAGTCMLMILYVFLTARCYEKKPEPTNLQKYWRKIRTQRG